MICIAETAAGTTHNPLLPLVILLGVLGGIKIAVDQWIQMRLISRSRGAGDRRCTFKNN
jgi:hypothetical protein